MAKKPEPVKRDLYQEVTDSIIEVMEQGRVPWVPGHVPADQSTEQAKLASRFEMPVSAITGKPYQGINPLILWASKTKNNFSSNAWMTFNQAKELGGNVLKGSRGSMVTYASPFVPKAEAEMAKKDGREPNVAFMLKGFTVFNLDQIENVPEEKLKLTTTPYDPIQIRGRTAEIIKNAKIDLKIGGDQPQYVHSISGGLDFIQIPHPDQFKNEDAYYHTLYHEMTHWTGNKDRLNRPFGSTRTSAQYAKEELIAELGSAYMSANMGMEPANDRHTAYLQGWLKHLKDDKKFIFQAATAASKASDYLLGFENVHALDWASKEAPEWSKDECQAAEKAFEADQAEGRYQGLSLEEYGEFKHRIWLKANPQEDQDLEASNPSLAA